MTRTGLLPTIHQLVELARGLAPCGRVLQLVRLGDDRLFLGLGMGALDVAVCDHLRQAWLNVVRAAEKRFHSASACGLSMCTDVR